MTRYTALAVKTTSSEELATTSSTAGRATTPRWSAMRAMTSSTGATATMGLMGERMGEDVIYGGGWQRLRCIGDGDGQRDKLYCGEGRDSYHADKIDYVDEQLRGEDGAFKIKGNSLEGA